MVEKTDKGAAMNNYEDKIGKRYGFYSKENGVDVETSEFFDIVSKEKNAEYKKNAVIANRKFELDPYSLTLDELIIIKKNNQLFTNKPKLYYGKGSFYISKKQNKDILKYISLETIGAMHLISSLASADGLILTANKRPIKFLKEIQDYYGINNRKWYLVKGEIEKNNLVREFTDTKNNKRKYIVLNPFFSQNSLEISELRFLCYGDIFKKELNFLDYLHLCIIYDFIPE